MEKILDNLGISTSTKVKEKKDERIVEVLYQKIGLNWYSFFEVDGKVFMGKIPEEALSRIRSN